MAPGLGTKRAGARTSATGPNAGATARTSIPIAPGAILNSAAQNSGVVSYRIPLLDDWFPISDPLSHWSFFMDLKPDFVVLPDPYIELVYNYSSTLLRGMGGITVKINDIPVDTHPLPTTGTLQVKWKTKIPSKFLKVGLNTIDVMTRQKSIEGAPCSDVDNQGNWLVFSPKCALYMQRKELGVYPLLNYPFPYIDRLAQDPVQAPITLPASPESNTIARALDLASDFGLLTQRPLAMRVRKGNAVIPGKSSVYIGDLGSVPSAYNGGLPSGAGLLSAFASGGKPQLTVAGTNPEGLDAAVAALGSPDLVDQMVATQLPITSKPDDSKKPPPRARLGSFTFEDLGLKPIHMAGGFHKSSLLTVMRPIRTDLGRESQIRIHFRHSASLNPLRSLISLYMNGIPIGSARLDPSNANGGQLVAYIPIDQLHRSRWIFKFEVFHDLGSIDCSKSYDEVAWTVIEDDSTINLKPGLLPGHPYLEDFPYLVPKDGLVPAQTSVMLSSNPSQAQLSFAATLAARAAQTNNAALHWTVTQGQIPDTAKTNSALLIGYYSEAQRFAKIANSLLAAPAPGGNLTISPRLRLLHAPLLNGVLVQAVPAPWSSSGLIYCILAPDDDALARFNRFLATSKAKDLIAGQALLFTRDGRVLVLDVTTSDDTRKGEEETEQNRYTPAMRIIIGLIVVLVIAGIVWIALQFVKRAPKDSDGVKNG